MIIETYAYPRAAVIGNPSDGYFGKTIAFVFSNFVANVQLYQTPELEIKPQRADVTEYANMQALVEDIHDLVNILFAEAILVAILLESFAGIYHKNAFPVISILFVDNYNTRRDASSVEKVCRKPDNAFYKPSGENILPD